jgi:hypothetical protein
VTRIIHLHVEAPPKPAFGATCNGCGVCCAAEPCPVGMVLSLKRSGACRMLRWSDKETRYFCGALQAAPAILKPVLHRWISAGSGCDCFLETTDKH